MRNLFLVILIISALHVLYAGSTNKVKIDTVSLDIFFRENPEYVAETIMVDVRLPKVRLSKEIVDMIMKHDLADKLRRYKSSGKIILSLAKYPWGRNVDTSYVFEPVTPAQPTGIKIINNTVPEIIGYLQYDDIYILLDASFMSQIIQSDSVMHDFKLKLVKRVRDLYCHWEYYDDGSAIRIYYSSETTSPNLWPPEEMIKLMNRMDEHEF